ncbi:MULTISPECIES: WD40/YVTN/BNR-like repeat-containing protein [Halomonadaceae]|uniref:Sortilin, neurotensin receptor 3 n=1 Tax=Modicisalibacter ilicicola DSM 19980 TaxID=1121942 RepID=A0A1M5CXL5_9GAMM|nr:MULTISPECIES: YCF48-related protein [Halomonas]SHF59411.1 Sortilin, neurotensin receptor 3 [Halomonas ilicicola DSM 19980]
MNNPASRFWRTLLLTSWVVASLGIAGVAGAAEEALPSLSYDRTGERLIKAQANQLFKSTDRGETWQELPLPEAVKEGQWVTASVPATAEQTLYIAGPSIGVQRSTDHGKTWQELDEDLPSENVIALATHRQQAETLYAVIADDGLYQSEDAGTTWKKMDSGPAQPVRRLVHSDMEGSMQTGWLYAVSDDAVRLSMDCFCGWRPTGELDAGRVYDVAYDLDAPERVYVATEQGLWRSDNGGQEWQSVTGDSPALVALAHSPAGTLYGLNREGELLRSDDRGQTWTPPDA